MKRILLLAVLFAVLAVAAFALTQSSSAPISANVISLKTNESTAGYARAIARSEWKFPDDHGPHPEFQTEWWYFVGNLDASDGRHFGYELTFFRRAITPTTACGVCGVSARESDWATNQIYFAHFAISDIKANDHFSTERFSRGAAGLAGGAGNPFRVWIENWSVAQIPNPKSQDPTSNIQLPTSNFQLTAHDAGHGTLDIGLDLTMRATKPPTLHGENGLHQKPEQIGNASYYVSLTRMDSAGELTVNGQTFKVTGLTWMDHEFSTAVLGADDVGWDWFAIQLSDQRELMFYQIRRKDGSTESLSSGTLVERDGTTRHITKDDVQLQALEQWKSSYSRATYPARWTLSIPSANLTLTITPFMTDQEMHVSIIYWEGAVQISGTSNGQPVRGVGYVELTGYASAFVQ